MSVVNRVQGKSVFDSLAAASKLTVLGLDVLMGIAASKGANTWVCDSGKAVSGTGKSTKQAFKTFAEAITKAADRDTILLLPGRYTEGALTIARAKSNLTIIGMGGRGAAYIQPSAAGQAGLDNRADDLTLINVGIAGADTAAAHALRNYGSRLRAYASKFEGALRQVIVGPGPMSGAALDAAYGEGADSRLEDCEIAWGTNGVVAESSTYGACTNLIVVGSLFHNLTGDALDETYLAVGFGSCRNIRVLDNTFENGEAGTEPTRYVDLDGTSNTGLVAGNRFATTIHDAAKIRIAAGVIYVGNYAEREGPSTGGGTLGRPD